MNLLDKEVLSDPIKAIKSVVQYSAKTGLNASFEKIRASFFTAYLGIDVKNGTEYAANFAAATNMSTEEQETLRYEWCVTNEQAEAREAEFQKDPVWVGKEPHDFVIVLQDYSNNRSLDDENAPVLSSKKIHFNINDFLKGMFMYVNRNQHGFICKREDFNQDSNKFLGTLRMFF